MIELLTDLFAYLRDQKKLWLLPLFILLALVGGLIVLTETAAVAPLIYTIF